MKKLLPMREELRNSNGKKRVVGKIRPYRAKITPLGIGDFKEGDESFTYRRKDIVWYKANSKAKPEILVFRGLAIWFYHEFVSDIDISGKRYRIFYNSVAKKFFANEFVKVRGKVYLKNPVDREISEQVEKIFVEANLPKNKVLDTLAHAKQRIEKFYKQEELKSRPKKKPVGNQPKVNLVKATLWCIKNHPKNLLHKRRTLLRAYKEFGEKTQLEDSFVKSVRSKWSNLIKEYSRQPEEFKKQNSLQSYAKTELKIPRTVTKQKTKENVKTFN
jgi:hypothetical protein